ncbi:MAG TPA: response regulator, partial [Phenylobacterium sp.]|nr:response regulator [Phenylobacterium sp.]
CREVITLMGGAIRLHSQPGQGATFTFEAPLPRVEAPEEAEGEVADALVQGELRVLIADDNPTNRVVLQTLLSHLGVASEAVGDGLKAVEAWSDRPWDVILMDIHMPDMDGLDASRLIRRREAEMARPRTPIVAVTASVLTHETEAYYAAGMDNVIAKPIEATRLVEVLQQSLSQATPSAVQVA